MSTKIDDEVLVTFTDYTPLKRAELQLQKYVEELKRSNANLEEFAYAASHDMKEPIRKIHFFADRLKEKMLGKLEEADQRLFDRMEYAAKRMGALIDDLLVYSHVSRGADIGERVDMNQKIALVLEDLELEIQEKQAKITVDPLPVITGHRRQLQQLFQNLIGNALKYSKPDLPPEVRIHAEKVNAKDVHLQLIGEEANRDYYLFQVEDKGIGFEQDEAERIFNVFTRLHGNAEYRGTGIGLSIARKVVMNHKGYIWAESSPGEGSVFKILLPAD